MLWVKFQQDPNVKGQATIYLPPNLTNNIGYRQLLFGQKKN